MSDDVTIDRATARTIAQYHRDRSKASRQLVSLEAAAWHSAIAEQLDPQPRSLRDQVARAWCAEVYGEDSGSALAPAPDQLDAADAVLAVVADWLAAQPLAALPSPSYSRGQRDHDVRLLRGTDD